MHPETDSDALALARLHARLAVPPSTFRRRAAAPDLLDAESLAAPIEPVLSRHSIRLLHRGSPDWMSGFDDLDDPPLLLYGRGRPLPPAGLLAVVGSRTEQPYARNVARDIVARWAALYPAGGIVSGGGLGVDHAALQAALTFGLHPVVVLAGGVDRPSPRTLGRLFDTVVEVGTLLSEAPPGTRPSRAAFPDRNRLIAAAALATVVVRGALRSGSLSTLRASHRLGRPTFAVVGPIDDPLSAGLHSAIRAGKASPLWHFDDLDALCPKRDTRKAPEVPEAPLTPELRVLRALSRGPAHPDAIATKLGLTSSEAAGIIATLELTGRVRRVAGGALQAA